MKHILLFTTMVTLVASAGCIFPGHRGGGDYGRHDEYRGHDEGRGHPEFQENPDNRSYPEPGVDVRIHG